ncbi:MAG TPA: S8 family serine peptidase, partial [Actinoplanes sp.]|nr:S8 family serine peptidase [Actinoplanes sp.]
EENDAYSEISGTSMATPHVAGAVALLAQKHPDWRATKLKATMTASAAPSDDLGPYAQGAGLTDVARAIGQQVTADPGSVGVERTTAAQSKTITYANGGSSAVTLDLALTSDAPAGLFTLSASKVTVPANGTAAVTLAVQPGTSLAEQPFGGELVATAGTARVVTPIAMDIARYTLTVQTPGTTGTDHTWVTLLTDLDRETETAFAHSGATGQVRVRPGHYVAQSYLLSGDENAPEITSIADPALTISGNKTVTFDTRAAKPVSIALTDKKAVPAYNEAGWTIRTKKPEIWGSNDPFGVLMNVDFAHLRTGPAVGSGKAPGYASYVTGSSAQPVNGWIDNSPAVYRFYFYERGRMMAGKKAILGPNDFAKVTSKVGADVPDAQVSRFAVARAPGNSPVTRNPADRQTPLSYGYDVPRTIVEYFNQDQQTEWLTTSSQRGYTYYQSDWRSFKAGRSYTEKWANGVIGPVFPEPDFRQQFAARYFGDTMGGPAPLHGDGSGHEGHRTYGGSSVDVWIYRNGKEIAHSTGTPQASQVPAEAGDYRMKATYRSDPVFTLSTVVDAEWTFRSGHVADSQAVNLPMTAIRFNPDLDIFGYAPAGRLFTLPISLDRQVGAAKAATRSLTVDVSFDDGKTWHRAPALRRGEKATAVVLHPRGSGFVSLRAAATDSAGNTVRETITRAYRFK